MEWSNEKVITFLEILQTEPCLWDPRLKSFKNRASQNDAWRRVIQLFPYETTIDEVKKKKASLMGYYRIHLNKFKKSLKAGAGNDDVYTTNWFAYETMDSFLREVYYESNRTLSTEIYDYSEAQELLCEEKNDEKHNSPQLSSEIEVSQNTLGENRTRPKEQKSSQDCGRKRQLRDDMSPEIRGARRQIDEAFEYIEEKEDNEYDTFGRLIASKLKKIRNPNTRDVLMNDIHNLVFRTCMADRLEQQSAASQFHTSHCKSSHHQVFSPSPNPSTYQSPPSPSTSLSPHHEINSPSNLDPLSVQSSQENLKLPPARVSRIKVKADTAGDIKIIKD